MITINRIGKQISGSVNGKPFSTSYTEDKWNTLKSLANQANAATDAAELNDIIAKFDAARKETLKNVIETKTPYIVIDPKDGKHYLRINNQVSAKALPKTFVDKILKTIENGDANDIAPLIKCWARFLRNPNYSERLAKDFAEYIMAEYTEPLELKRLQDEEGFSYDVAKDLATGTQVSITMEGLLAGYKVSRELHDRFILDEEENVKMRSRFGLEIDENTGEKTYKKPDFVEDRTFEPPVMGKGGDAFYCIPEGGETDFTKLKPGHIIKVGHRIALDSWDKVDTSTNSCVKGLHVGGLNYIDGYRQSTDAVTQCVFIDPMNIGSIVGLGKGNDGAMRVKEYFVYGSFVGVNKQMYHSSTYGKLNDAEYAKLVAEAVEKDKKAANEAQRLVDQRNSLVSLETEADDAGKLLIQE